MDVSDVTTGLAAIRAIADDDESAHGEEDELRARVLQAIADGATDPAALAAEVLKTRDIEFSRWCA